MNIPSATPLPGRRILRPLLLLSALMLLVLPFELPNMLRAAPATNATTGWDDRFGVPGMYNGEIVAAAMSAAGELYVAGAFQSDEASVAANRVARWDGARWHALGDGLSGDLGRARAIATHATNVYVVGAFTQAGNVTARQVARWDGARWHALGNGIGPGLAEGDAAIYAVAVAPNGDVYVGGRFTRIDATPANGIARWDGARWHALGSGIVDRGVLGGEELFPANVYALAVGPDGHVYAGGQFSDAGDQAARNVARWDGTRWHALGAGVRGGDIFDGNQVTALAVDGERLYVGGSFTQAGETPATNLAQWDGTAWSALGAGVTAELSAPAPVQTLLAHNGALYAGGTFTSAGAQPIIGVARWDGAQWSTIGPPLSAAGSRVTVRTLAAAPDGSIFVGGAFERAADRVVNGIARWKDATWTNLGEGATLLGDSSALVEAIARDAAGNLYIGGLINAVGGLAVNNIAMWDGVRWHALGAGVTPGPDGIVEAILVVGDNVYVGGYFTQAGGQSANRIARWHIPTKRWAAVGAGFDGPVNALTYGNGILYAGGSFVGAGGSTARDIAAWDGARWQSLGGDWEIFEVLDTGKEAGTFVDALAYHNGELFIGGRFQTIHRKAASSQDPTSYWYVHNVVGYAPDSGDWFALGPAGAAGVTTNGISNINTRVQALAVVNGGLYIGGVFNRGGGRAAPALARWDLRSGAWSSPGIPTSTGPVSVRTLAGIGGSLLVGGTFTGIDDAPARSVAVLDSVTGNWSALAGGLGWRNGVARVNAAVLTADSAYVGGEFTSAGPHPSVGIAGYRGTFGGNTPPPETAVRVHLPLLRR